MVLSGIIQASFTQDLSQLTRRPKPQLVVLADGHNEDVREDGVDDEADYGVGRAIFTGGGFAHLKRLH